VSNAAYIVNVWRTGLRLLTQLSTRYSQNVNRAGTASKQQMIPSNVTPNQRRSTEFGCGVGAETGRAPGTRLANNSGPTACFCAATDLVQYAEPGWRQAVCGKGLRRRPSGEKDGFSPGSARFSTLTGASAGAMAVALRGEGSGGLRHHRSTLTSFTTLSALVGQFASASRTSMTHLTRAAMQGFSPTCPRHSKVVA
jgi:hypothetical protein